MGFKNSYWDENCCLRKQYDTRLNIFNDKSKGNRFNISIFVAYKKLLLFNNPMI
jgi:hypothetical protein